MVHMQVAYEQIYFFNSSCFHSLEYVQFVLFPRQNNKAVGLLDNLLSFIIYFLSKLCLLLYFELVVFTLASLYSLRSYYVNSISFVYFISTHSIR